MSKQIYLYGSHSVNILAKKYPEFISKIYILQKNNNIVNYIKKNNLSINIEYADKKILDKLAGANSNHQGVVAACDPNIFSLDNNSQKNDLQSCVSSLIIKNPQHKLFILILDGVQDPHNLGACIRSAEAMGVDCVIIPKHNSSPVNSTVCKVSSGAALLLPIFQVTNLSRTIDYLKEQGVWLYGSSMESGVDSLYNHDLKDHMALVMGSEGSGMRKLTQKQCDYKFTIPMVGEAESLNVSVATGICLYEVARQRV